MAEEENRVHRVKPALNEVGARALQQESGCRAVCCFFYT